MERDPDTELALTAFGAVLLRDGQFEEALPYLMAAAIAADYFLAMTHTALGNDQESQDWYQKATEHSEKILADGMTATGESVSWNRRLTLELLQSEAAERIATRQIALQPTPITVRSRTEKLEERMSEVGDRGHRMFLAMAHWRLGNKATARRVYGEGAAWIAAYRKGSDEHARLSATAAQMLELNEAERDELMSQFYTAADIGDAQGLVNRGHWHRANGNPEKAVEDLTAALRLEPDSKDGKLWRSRGLAYFGLNQYEDALSDLSKAMELNPEDGWSLYRRGQAHQRLGQFDLALEDLTEAINREPWNRKLYLYRAFIYRDREEFDAALADCQKAIDLDPERDERSFRRIDAYTLRGDIYADNLQQYDKAAKEYAKALELDPQNAAIADKHDRALQAIEPLAAPALKVDEAPSPAESPVTTAE